jgi:hypothetical protein
VPSFAIYKLTTTKMAKKTLNLFIAMIVIALTPLQALATDNLFSDLADTHENKEAILYLKNLEIIDGYDNGTFKPEKEINRAEFLKILVEGIGLTPTVAEYSDCFTDVKTDWFAPYVCYSKSVGWVDGYDDGSFKPSQIVNKVEAIKMLLNSQDIEVPSSISVKPFDDVAIDAWFAPFIKVAKDMGILEETGNYLSPTEDMKRSSICENLYRTLTYLGNNSQDNENEGDEPQTEKEDPEEETIEPETTKVEISGSGTTVSEEFSLEEGLTFAEVNYTGSNNFIVKMLSVDSDNTEYIANEIDDYNGKKVFKVRNSGKFVLDVTATGSWDIEFEQPQDITSGQNTNSLTGNGDTISDFIEMDEGFYKFETSHNGDSNFIVQIVDLNGDTEAYITNEIGDYEGTKGNYIDNGIYLFSINADGNWNIDFEEVDTSGNAEALNIFSGTGDIITPIFSVNQGLKTFNLTHEGDSNFIIHLIKPNGSTEAYLANEIGDFDGSTAEYLDSGNYFMQVEADGNWSIEIE